ncbi:hypothetical protein R3P38DRAFT_3182138 [Favolaschia claudopus]|uniref:Uncharacterized protein n=1 Tax=Favolaschia claudopus TaxID=2862362 RepID=A0AAW0CGN5_9AGAR
MFSNIPSRILSANITPFTSFFLLAVHGLFAISHSVNQADVNVQPRLQVALALSCAAITIVTCAATWARSPAHPPNKYGRLRKADPPPPGPPPPQENPGDDVNANEGAEEEQNDGDGGDNGDPQDGVDVNDEDVVYDNLATDAAPAPEDPPPPPGDIEQGDDDDGFLLLKDDLGWLILLLLGRLCYQLFNRKQRHAQSAHIGESVKGQSSPPAVDPVEVQGSTLKPIVVNASSRSYTIDGLLRRPCTPPSPPLNKPLSPDTGQFIPTAVQVSVVTGVPSSTVHRALHRPLWWGTWLFFALLRAFGFFGTILGLLLPLGNNPSSSSAASQQQRLPYEQAQLGPELPPPLSSAANVLKSSPSLPPSPSTSNAPLPPPSPRLVPLPLSPRPESAARMIRLSVVERITLETVRRQARQLDEDVEEDRMRRQHLRGLQKEIWRQLYEPRLAGKIVVDGTKVVI